MNYVPSSIKERKQMLKSLGYDSYDDLYQAVPAALKLNRKLDIPDSMTEFEVLDLFDEIAAKNTVYKSIFRGAGAYDHYIPSVVKTLTSRSEFVTGYTPYQAEMSQGTLQSIFEYQTMICKLTGMDVSNASVYDAPTAAAEAISMTRERKTTKALISATVNPETLKVAKAYMFGYDMDIEIIPEKDGKTDLDALKKMLSDEACSVYIESPNFYGVIEDAEEIGDFLKDKKTKFIMGAYPISMALLKSPRECGADIAVGDAQSLGMPLSYGGPYVGFMATTDKLMRKLPGRICGQTIDADGKRAFVLTLQAREQHIRREKASSNICSNQALCALIVTVHLAALGKEGLNEVAINSASNAHYLANEMVKIDGFRLAYEHEFFNEFVSVCDKGSDAVLAKLAENGILGGYPIDDKKILWCATEKNTKASMDKLIKLLKEV